jgi:integrase
MLILEQHQNALGESTMTHHILRLPDVKSATLHSTLTHLKRFFFWLADRPHYKSRIQYSDSEYFSLSNRDARIATSHHARPTPTLAQIRRAIELMPTTNEIERRDQALVAFAILTGARDSAIASIKLKHIDVMECVLYQDASEVNTKFAKTFPSFFFPVGDEIRKILVEWFLYLRDEKLWGHDDPLFPATSVVYGASRQFEVAGLDRRHWRSAQAIRKVFRSAFENAGLPYFNPHSFRNTLVLLGQEKCQSAEQYKVWSQNLGHERVLTTFMNYGSVAPDRQGVIMRELGR